MLDNGCRVGARAALLAASVFGSMAMAQVPTAEHVPTQADEVFSNIIVTAQGRQEQVQSVPIAISAFSADLLSRRRGN